MNVTFTHHARDRFKERFGGKLPKFMEYKKDFTVLYEFEEILLTKIKNLSIYAIMTKDRGVVKTVLTKKQVKNTFGKNINGKPLFK